MRTHPFNRENNVPVEKHQPVSVIIPAAGSGTRFGASQPKQFLDLVGIPILVRTLLVFEQTPCIQNIVIAASADFHLHIKELCDEYGISKCAVICEGGTERQHSINNALQTAPILSSEITLVHDAVRPFITPDFVARLVDAANSYGAAVPGLSPKDTIKEINADGSVRVTHQRQNLRAIQTPQAFRYAVLNESYKYAQRQGFVGTDDASVVEFAGGTVHVIDGIEENIKITTPIDFFYAEEKIKAKAKNE